ncbi:MAG: UxaA family hydrolase, partial [Cetobacterium sp.]
MKKYIKINKKDNVGVALCFISKGENVEIDGKKIEIKEDIKKGHKFSIETIESGKNIIKYGMPIGHSLKKIELGEWIHTHNLKTNLSDLDTYSYSNLNDFDLEKNKSRKV